MSTTVDAGSLLAELNENWRLLGKDASGGVLRACSMTLIVVASPEDDPQSLGETLAGLMHAHPNRTIVLRITPAGPVQARTSIQCWMPFGRRQQVCCEQIEIEAPPSALDEVPPVLLGLMVADLPVAVWCRTPHLAALPELAPVLRLAGKVIVDTGRLALSDALPVLRQLAQGPWRLADLAWARITLARQHLAAPPDPMGRAYFDAWLGPRPTSSSAAPPPADDAELLREELGLCDRDPQFETVLASLL